ncbi:MAG TPA: M14 family zinc carboxypeptidase [Phycisphaerae bacterium]|nr:hypothetical protein [Phycisphaerales bacterium]HRX85450.1 M14 family zinc carboxypeptidase [Phycisphaerae bacterium]
MWHIRTSAPGASRHRRACAVLAVLALSAAATAAGPAHLHVQPATPNRAAPTLDDLRAARDRLVALGFDVDRCGFDLHAGTLGVDVISDHDRAALLAAGFTVSAEESLAPVARTQTQYYDPDEIAAILQQAAIDHPAITHVFSIGTTYEGRPIWAIEISDNPGVPEDEPAILFNAQHHAREVATSHVGIDVVEQLTNNYGSDAHVTDWVNDYKTVVVPMVNPDGVAYVFANHSSWRKNRQLHSCYGVDLNRNYPYLWGPGCGSSGTCSSDLYRGPSVASEFETQAMIALADTYHFVMATSYHSYGRFIDYPYACATGAPSTLMPEHPVIDEMMNGMADAIDAVDSTPRYDVNSPVPAGGVNGDDTSWYYAYRGTYSFIVEVGTSFEPNFSLVAGIVSRNRAGWQYLYQRLGAARIDVHVADACSGAPLAAEVTLTNYAFDTGELPRYTFLPYGRWTFMVPPNGTYTVRISKPGYVTQDVPVSVSTLPAGIQVALEQTSPPPTIYGDTDCDGDVDIADLQRFEECLTGPVPAVDPGCSGLDANDDNHVDLLDFAAFQAAYTG